MRCKCCSDPRARKYLDNNISVITTLELQMSMHTRLLGYSAAAGLQYKLVDLLYAILLSSGLHSVLVDMLSDYFLSLSFVLVCLLT